MGRKRKVGRPKGSKRGRKKGTKYKWGYAKGILSKFKRHSAKASKYEMLARKERKKCRSLARHL